MKNYSETRGQASKIDFDSATGQFISKPILHEFAARSAQNIIVQKLGELRTGARRKKAKKELTKVLANMTPHARDDLGMAEVFATASQG